MTGMTLAEWARTARAYRGPRRRFYWLRIIAAYPRARRNLIKAENAAAGS